MKNITQISQMKLYLNAIILNAIPSQQTLYTVHRAELLVVDRNIKSHKIFNKNGKYHA